MNDNTSNTPDNASRPGKAPHPVPSNGKLRRDENGRFLPRKRNADTESVLDHPLAGSNGEMTVGEFLETVNNFTESDQVLGNVIREVDAKNKKKSKDRKRTKVVSGSRRTLLYQIRTLPDHRGYGLFYADGVEIGESGTTVILTNHWFGEGGYPAFDSGAAVVFATPDEAREFRRNHFNVKVDDETVRERRKARYARGHVFRVELGYGDRRQPSHTTKNKTERKPRKPVREDLVKLYNLTGRTH